MDSPQDAHSVLDYEYLPVRAKILEIAASLDRIERSAGDVQHDPRREQLQAALGILLEAQPERAERIQRLFSRPYDSQWQETFQTTRS